MVRAFLNLAPGPATVSQIASVTGLTWYAVERALHVLKAAVFPGRTGKRGRPAKMYSRAG